MEAFERDREKRRKEKRKEKKERERKEKTTAPQTRKRFELTEVSVKIKGFPRIKSVPV